MDQKAIDTVSGVTMKERSFKAKLNIVEGTFCLEGYLDDTPATEAVLDYELRQLPGHRRYGDRSHTLAVISDNETLASLNLMSGEMKLSKNVPETEEVRNELGRLFRTIQRRICQSEAPLPLLIVSDEIQIGPIGLDLWFRVVEKYLRHCPLAYKTSVLSSMVRQHSGYGHKHTLYFGA